MGLGTRDGSLTPGKFHDSQCADALIEGVEAGAIIADKAYDADRIIVLVEGQG